MCDVCCAQSEHIALATINLILIGSFTLLIQLLVDDSPTAKLVMRCVVLIWVSCFTVSLVIVPKIVYLASRGDFAGSIASEVIRQSELPLTADDPASSRRSSADSLAELTHARSRSRSRSRDLGRFRERNISFGSDLDEVTQLPETSRSPSKRPIAAGLRRLAELSTCSRGRSRAGSRAGMAESSDDLSQSRRNLSIGQRNLSIATRHTSEPPDSRRSIASTINERLSMRASRVEANDVGASRAASRVEANAAYSSRASRLEANAACSSRASRVEMSVTVAGESCRQDGGVGRASGVSDVSHESSEATSEASHVTSDLTSPGSSEAYGVCITPCATPCATDAHHAQPSPCVVLPAAGAQPVAPGAPPAAPGTVQAALKLEPSLDDLGESSLWVGDAACGTPRSPSEGSEHGINRQFSGRL